MDSPPNRIWDYSLNPMLQTFNLLLDGNNSKDQEVFSMIFSEFYGSTLP